MRNHARNYGFQSNKQLMLYLKEVGYIKSSFVFDIMCSVDRKNFVTNHCAAYRDRPEIVAYDKTISAPHMHAEVLEQMSNNLRHGKNALDIGSGSGYLTVCMALAMGEKGHVIGVDCIPGFQSMANDIVQNHYPELLQDNRVEFIVWDGRRGWPWSGPYDVIHVGVAAENIPDTLIEQLAPGGCLIMPVGSENNQVLVLLKKSLNGTIQRKELMKVQYGNFVDVDLPWSSKIENSSVLKEQNKSKNALVQELQNTSATKTFENVQNDKKVETEALEAVDKKFSNVNQSVNSINDAFWKSLENISESIASKPVPKLACNIQNPKGHMAARQTVFEKIEIFEQKDANCRNLKSAESIGLIKHTARVDETENLEKAMESTVGHEESGVKQLNMKLECSLPKATESDTNIQAVNEKIDISEKNVVDHEISTLQEAICAKMESNFENSDETISVDTDEDTQSMYEKYGNNNLSMTTIHLTQKKHDINKSFSKSLENFQTIREPVSYLKSSISTILAREINKMPNVREKIEIFEKNLGNGKLAQVQNNVAMKMKSITRERDNTVFENLEENTQYQKSVESIQNSTETLHVVEKDRNRNSRKDCEKIGDEENSRELFISELDTLKDEIKVMLSKYLSDEKDNSEETKLRDINIHIDEVKQIQLMNNHDSLQNLEQTAKSNENVCSAETTNKQLNAKERDSENNELQVELTNVTEKVEKIQAQFDKYIEKNVAINEELQQRCIYYENLDKRMNKLNHRFKIFTRILAKLIQKSKCHEKVLNVYLAIAEKGETSRVFEQQKLEKTKEKIKKCINIITQMNDEFKIIGCNFVDDSTEDEDKPLVKQSEPMSDAKVHDSESYLSELNIIRNLLYTEIKDPVVEDESFFNVESESADEEYEVSLLKLLMEE